MTPSTQDVRATGLVERQRWLLDLHQRHLIACGVEMQRALAADRVPTTRADLLELYEAILDYQVELPKWLPAERHPRALAASTKDMNHDG